MSKPHYESNLQISLNHLLSLRLTPSQEHILERAEKLHDARRGIIYFEDRPEIRRILQVEPFNGVSL